MKNPEIIPNTYDNHNSDQNPNPSPNHNLSDCAWSLGEVKDLDNLLAISDESTPLEGIDIACLVDVDETKRDVLITPKIDGFPSNDDGGDLQLDAWDFEIRNKINEEETNGNSSGEVEDVDNLFTIPDDLILLADIPCLADVEEAERDESITPEIDGSTSNNDDSDGGDLQVAVWDFETCKKNEEEQKGKGKEEIINKGTKWSQDEHRLFLLGVKKFKKGAWKSISRCFVPTRFPTQVASHAQKFFHRQDSSPKERKRSSIHDINCVDSQSLAELFRRGLVDESNLDPDSLADLTRQGLIRVNNDAPGLDNISTVPYSEKRKRPDPKNTSNYGPECSYPKPISVAYLKEGNERENGYNIIQGNNVPNYSHDKPENGHIIPPGNNIPNYPHDEPQNGYNIIQGNNIPNYSHDGLENGYVTPQGNNIPNYSHDEPGNGYITPRGNNIPNYSDGESSYNFPTNYGPDYSRGESSYNHQTNYGSDYSQQPKNVLNNTFWDQSSISLSLNEAFPSHGSLVPEPDIYVAPNYVTTTTQSGPGTFQTYAPSPPFQECTALFTNNFEDVIPQPSIAQDNVPSPLQSSNSQNNGNYEGVNHVYEDQH